MSCFFRHSCIIAVQKTKQGTQGIQIGQALVFVCVPCSIFLAVITHECPNTGAQAHQVIEVWHISNAAHLCAGTQLRHLHCIWKRSYTKRFRQCYTETMRAYTVYVFCTSKCHCNLTGAVRLCTIHHTVNKHSLTTPAEKKKRK